MFSQTGFAILHYVYGEIKMQIASITLGCKVNQFETNAMMSVLISRGHTPAKPGAGCDACIINTCAVTAESARKSRQAVRRIRKIEPEAIIAVCGCYSQLEPSTAQALGADFVGGAGMRLDFALEIERLAAQRGTGTNMVAAPSSFRAFEELPPGSGATAKTRALLKIQDGCDSFCAYCVVPYTRGRSRSLPVGRAVEQARQLEEQGFREIVVTGIEIASYGRDLQVKQGDCSSASFNTSGAMTPGDEAEEPSPCFTSAVQAIAAAAPRARIRLGSLDPRAITEDFCRALEVIPNLCNHFHLSLQSGCDATLLRMGRKYGSGEVRDSIGSLRRFFPDCGITADLITGFPGETDEEYESTLGFIKEAGFTGMHIFPFSPRPGTRAAAMPGQIEKSVRIRRARTASEAAEQIARDFVASQVGKIVQVLFERKRDGLWTGHSANYLEVSVRSGGGKNVVLPVRITGADEGIIWGEVIR